ncbi:hypothetical protein F5Y15DRAFT_312205 [Xylariaceae sp. FL0016]|nr:hypothetical protein F5Y15DRAFT_312205 [Xylariaceae sp. FL0016]
MLDFSATGWKTPRDASLLPKFSPSLLKPEVETFVRETLCRLREVFVVHEMSMRNLIGGGEGIDLRVIRNDSVPIGAMQLPFERLSRDPRPLSPGLKRVFINQNFGDSRACFRHWRQFTQDFGVAGHSTEYSYLMTYTRHTIARTVVKWAHYFFLRQVSI